MKTPIVILALLMTGCGAVRSAAPAPAPSPIAHVYTAKEVFNIQPGQRWTMENANGSGEQWHIEILSRPDYQACQSGTFLDFHNWKTNAVNSLSAVGVPSFDSHFILKADGGSYRAVNVTLQTDTPNPWFKVGISTSQFNTVAGHTPPYFILPAQISDGQTIADNTEYEGLSYFGADETTCLTKAMQNNGDGIVPWVTSTTVVQVSTPVYTGPAVAVRYCEGSSCYGQPETWYFAPGVGFVQDTREGTSAGTVTMKRITIQD